MTGGAPVPQPIGAGVTAWERGEAGIDTYRIPALVVAKNGDLLAFAEARHGGRSDTGDIDIVMKRSRDGGRTWSEQRTVWDDGRNTCGNPCPVVVTDTGAVVLLTTRKSEIVDFCGEQLLPRDPMGQDVHACGAGRVRVGAGEGRRPLTMAVTGRRRKIIHCESAQLRRSGSRLWYASYGV
mgnify:CR=1 FL=1